jgi:hypothetical protein
MAIDDGKDVQQIDVAKLQKELKENPLADHSIFEILTDNDDKDHTEITGEWEIKKYGCYGPDMLVSKGQGTVKFIPDIPRKGQYDVYVYIPKISGSASKISMTVFDGVGDTERTVRPSEVIVEGQTSGEWVSLGSYTLPKGLKSHVVIHAENADGIVPADAIVWAPSVIRHESRSR